MSIDDELRRALRPVDPGPDFTARVLAAVEAGHDGAGQAAGDQGATLRRRLTAVWRRRPWLWPVLAASLVGAVVGAGWLDARREAERGEQARMQVIQALRLTTSKLVAARDVVEGQP